MDLSVLPAAQRPPEVERLAREEARAPFDLAHGPLLRARLLRLGRDEHVLMLAMHHIVSDWWSMGILVKEQAQLYVAFAAGQASPLPELPIQYADYALWQRREQVAERFDGQLQYWTRQLDGAPTRLERLGVDAPGRVAREHRSPGHLMQSRGAFGVVEMAVREHDQRDRAVLGDAGQVAFVERPRVDDDAFGLTRLAQHPCVRPVESHRARVGGEQSKCSRRRSRTRRSAFAPPCACGWYALPGP